MRIALISDTHLAPSAEDFVANCDCAVDWINTAGIDLVIHLGDIAADGIHDPGHFDVAARTLQRLDPPLLIVPGNHDVGEPNSGHEPPFSSERLKELVGALGSERWLRRSGDWTLIGMNSQKCGAEEEDEQIAWLETAAAECVGPVALFLHKPWFLSGPGDEAAHRYVPAPSLARIRHVLGGVDVRLVASGHIHQFRRHEVDGVKHAWIGSTAFLIPDRWQEVIGTKTIGFAVLALNGDKFTLEDVTAPGMRQLDLADYAKVYPELLARD